MSAVVSITDDGTTGSMNVGLKEGAASAASVPNLDNLIGGAYVPPTTGGYMPVSLRWGGKVLVSAGARGGPLRGSRGIGRCVVFR